MPRPSESRDRGLIPSFPRPDGDLWQVTSFQPEQTWLPYQTPGKTFFFLDLSGSTQSSQATLYFLYYLVEFFIIFILFLYYLVVFFLIW